MPAIPAIVAAGIGAAGTIVASNQSASAAKKAANTQATAFNAASATTREAADKARNEILSRMPAALTEYRSKIYESKQQLISGESDVISILQDSTGQADSILTQAGADARSAMIGSSGMSQGIPFSQAIQQHQLGSFPGGPGGPALDIPSNAGLSKVGSQGVELKRYGQPIGMDFTGGSGATGGLGSLSSIPETSQTSPLYPVDTPPITGENSIIPVTNSAMPTTQNPSGIGFEGARSHIATGTQKSLSDVTQGSMGAINALTAAGATARNDINSGMSNALGELSPYLKSGESASKLEADLTGVNGPEAQQAAIDSYIESPGQVYLREQQEKALLRNSAAIGGLGGANVRTALQKQAMGIASTDMQQHINNLRSISSGGLQAAGAASNVHTGGSNSLAEIASGMGTDVAGVLEKLGISKADLSRMSATQQATLATNIGNQLASLSATTGADRVGLLDRLASGASTARTGLAADLARLSESEGNTALGQENNIAQLLANLAIGAGTQISNNQVQAGSSLAAGQNLQGQAQANMVSGLANIGQDFAYQTLSQVPWNAGNSGLAYSGSGTYGVTPTNQSHWNTWH
jgi:hypothetical protein